MVLYLAQNNPVRVKMGTRTVRALTMQPIITFRPKVTRQLETVKKICQSPSSNLHATHIIILSGDRPSKHDILVEWDQRQKWIDEGETKYPGKVVGRIVKKSGKWILDDRRPRREPAEYFDLGIA